MICTELREKYSLLPKRGGVPTPQLPGKSSIFGRHGQHNYTPVAWCGAVRTLHCGNPLSVRNGRRC